MDMTNLHRSSPMNQSKTDLGIVNESQFLRFGIISHYLMGHAPQGISQKYIATLILQNGPAMRAAQERISKRIVSLLGLKLGDHHDAPLVPDTPTRVEASRKKSKVAAPARIAQGSD